MPQYQYARVDEYHLPMDISLNVLFCFVLVYHFQRSVEDIYIYIYICIIIYIPFIYLRLIFTDMALPSPSDPIRVQDLDGKSSQTLSWLAAHQDPKVIVHPVAPGL